VEGLSFPARFLVRLADARGGRVILDPAEGWRMLTVPDLRAALKRAAGPAVELAPTHYAALGNRDILVRLQNDIKMRALRVGAMDRALLAVETALLFAPAHAALWREAGLMNLRLRRPAQAVAALEQFVSRTGDGHDRIRIAQLINEIRGGML
jgi:regulator of sirC expression with transglutaminase-like and TPR domain